MQDLQDSIDEMKLEPGEELKDHSNYVSNVIENFYVNGLTSNYQLWRLQFFPTSFVMQLLEEGKIIERWKKENVRSELLGTCWTSNMKEN